MTWDITTPLGSDPAAQGDDNIRALKADLQTALRGDDTEGLESRFPGSDTANPVFRYRGLKGATAARPVSGEYGLFFDTTRNVLQRDNGSSWDDVGTVIPAGTVMVFYQAAAPTGWTKVVTQNDKALRVVSAAGGGSGGTDAISTGHSHTVTAHTHTYGLVAHQHLVPVYSNAGETQNFLQQTGTNRHGFTTIGSVSITNAFSLGALGATVTLTAANESLSGPTSGVAADSTSGSTAPGMDTKTMAYIDVIVCSKD